MSEDFFAVIDEQIVGLDHLFELPDEFLRSIPHQLDTVFKTSTLAIGGWENSTDGPLVLALEATGQIVSVVAVNPAQIASLANTLSSIDYWLSSMTLPNLSELSGNSVDFYEGLLELSPHASIVLAPRRRFLLVTAADDLDIARVQAQLPNADIDVIYLDVLRAPGGPAIVRRRDRSLTPVPASDVPASDVHVSPPPAPISTDEASPAPTETELPAHAPGPEIHADHEGAPENEAVEIEAVDDQALESQVDDQALETEAVELGTVAVPLQVQTVDADETRPEDAREAHVPEFSIAASEPEVIELSDTSTIDLTEIELSPPPPVGAPVPNPLAAGRTYDLDVLPLLFDATGKTLESINNELFAVNDAIVIVAKLPERRRDTPFEDRRRFRWDTTLERIQLLNEHGIDVDGVSRTVHLFVESERQPNYAVYVGELDRTAFQTQTQTDSETAWFSIEPALESDLYRSLRRGRLPQHRIDISSF